MPTASEMASDDCIAFVFSDQEKTLVYKDLTRNEASQSHLIALQWPLEVGKRG